MSIQRANGTVFEIEGKGPDVVLIHGLGLNRHLWEAQLTPLEAHYRVVRYDLLGHGDSNKPKRPCEMRQFVDQLSALIGELGLERCALIGFSLGGLIAQAFTLAHPEAVCALVILNSAHGRTEEERSAILQRVRQSERQGPQSTAEAALERWFTPAFAARRPDVMDQVRGWIAANDPEVYPRLYELLAKADIELTDSIRHIRCPTLIVTGGKDHGNSPAMARRMAALIPGARVEIIPDLRHMALAENPDAVNALLLPFLAETLAAQSGTTRPDQDQDNKSER